MANMSEFQCAMAGPCCISIEHVKWAQTSVMLVESIVASSGNHIGNLLTAVAPAPYSSPGLRPPLQLRE